MNEPRITWTTRINIRPTTIELVRQMARNERMSIATMIGELLETSITSRSTS